MHARVAWVIVALSATCAVVDTAITAAYLPLLSQEAWAHHGWPLATSAALGCALMGALIVSRHPRHLIGWLLCAASLASVSLATETYALWVLDHGGPGPDTAGHVASWVSVLVGAPFAIAALTLVFLIAPDGRLRSPRWRWAARASVLGLLLYTAAVLTLPPTEFRHDDESVPVLAGVLSSAGFLLIGLALVSAAVCLVLRLRAAAGETRRQLLWVASSAAFLAFGLVWLVAVQAMQGVQGNQGDQTLLAALPLFTAYLAFPVCTAVAVLRHRLFDIDLIVNRALVVTLATAVVAVGYVAAVVVLGAAIGTGGFWPSLLATALVAMAFQPLRRWVVRVADRLAYGPAAAPYEALADFSRRLGESPDPTILLSAVADAAGTAVGARAATARIPVPVPGAPDHVATWPPHVPAIPAGTGVDVPVTDRDEQLGTITVAMPPGRELRSADHLLLRDLADQAAIAFRNAKLSAELAHRVDELDQRASELAESRERLITAGDAARSRLEHAIARQVVPHLEPLPSLLDELAATAGRRPQPSGVRPLVAAATSALEELREITRGVFPAQLARSGLEPALSSLLGRTGTGRLEVDPSATGRLDPRIEAAAYFCVAEAARELLPPVRVGLSTVDDRLRIEISGCHQAEIPVASLRDRVETVDGTVTTTTTGQGRTVLEVLIPARPPVAAMT